MEETTQSRLSTFPKADVQFLITPDLIAPPKLGAIQRLLHPETQVITASSIIR